MGIDQASERLFGQFGREVVQVVLEWVGDPTVPDAHVRRPIMPHDVVTHHVLEEAVELAVGVESSVV